MNYGLVAGEDTIFKLSNLKIGNGSKTVKASNITKKIKKIEQDINDEEDAAEGEGNVEKNEDSVPAISEPITVAPVYTASAAVEICDAAVRSKYGIGFNRSYKTPSSTEISDDIFRVSGFRNMSATTFSYSYRATGCIVTRGVVTEMLY